MMQTDVKSAYRVNDGVLFAGRTRLKGIFYTVTVVGTAPVIYDNAASAAGDALVILPADTLGAFNVVIPGEGLLATNGMYLDMNSGNAITVFYG